jgi:hypothetical protein
MESSMELKLKRILNEELIKRLLIQYFINKGIQRESFDKNIYPPIMQDIVMQMPHFMGKLEVQPFVEDIDPNSGNVKLGWNLFVLGTRRMYLGRSTHKNLAELKDSVNGPINKFEHEDVATPGQIVEFITHGLSDSEQGIIDKDPEVDASAMQGMSPVGSAQFYGSSQGFEKNKPVF